MKHIIWMTGLMLAVLGATPALAQLTPDEQAVFDRALEMLGDDPAGAKRLIEPLAAKGDGEALNFLSVLLHNGGPGWEPDPARAAELREAAVKAGSTAAALNLAISLLMDSAADHERAVELLKVVDTQEGLRSIATYPWGRAYLFGWGVKQDMKKGVGYLEEFANSREEVDDMMLDAHFLVGRAYRNGWNVPVDARKAYRHFRIAADLGDPRAQWNVGMMLIAGEGVAPDEAAAFRYVQMSARSGHLDGMISLAVMLATGQGTDENDESAREWYLAAAKQRSAHAMRGAGMMLVTGEGGARSPALGMALLQLAAQAGDEIATTLLESMPADVAREEEVAAARAQWLADYGAPHALN